jgi:hypothetical protein
MAEYEKHDIEAAKGPTTENTTEIEVGTVEEIKRTKELQNSSAVLRKLRAGEEWLDAKMGIELQGVDRIPEDQKQPPSIWNVSQPDVSTFCFKAGIHANRRYSSCGGPSMSTSASCLWAS